MIDLKSYIRNVPDFPQPGILFRDISPLLRHAFGPTIEALSALLDEREWSQVEAVAGIESRGAMMTTCFTDSKRDAKVSANAKVSRSMNSVR